VHPSFGARQPDGLYDLPALDKLAAEHPWLTVIPVVSAGRLHTGEVGRLADVVMRKGTWTGHDVYVAGPSEMVQETVARLVGAGTPPEHIHLEDFGSRDR
jgi:NAD(P)H-flavin reductase